MSAGGAVVWITGLFASGKSTLAARTAARLRDAGAAAVVLDGDDVREVFVPPHGYDDAGRDAFYRTLAGLAALIARQGTIVIVPATAHLRRWREYARRFVLYPECAQECACFTVGKRHTTDRKLVHRDTSR